MRTASTLVSLVVGLLALAGSAGAATLRTGPLARGTSGPFVCDVANASTKPREVVISILNPAGDVVIATTPTVLTPGQLLSTSNTAVGGRSCRVDVKGARKTVRVSFYVLEVDGNPTAVVQGQCLPMPLDPPVTGAVTS
jgi:hypothetical protein